MQFKNLIFHDDYEKPNFIIIAFSLLLLLNTGGVGADLGHNQFIGKETWLKRQCGASVTPPSTTWIATTNAFWLHLNAANQSGAGSTNVFLRLTPTPVRREQARFTIAGQTLTVTQAVPRMSWPIQLSHWCKTWGSIS